MSVRRALSLLVHPEPEDLPATQARVRRAGLSSVGMALGRGIQIAVTLVSVPLLLEHLGASRFGLLMGLVAFTSWFHLDLGLAEGVKLRLIRCFARGDRAAARAYVSTGAAGLAAVALALALAFGAVWSVVPWEGVFNAHGALAAEVRRALAVSMALALGAVPLKLLREVYTAEQRGYVHSAWVAAGAAGSLPALVAAVRLDAGLAGCAAALQGPLLLASVASAAHLFASRPWLAPRPRLARRWAWRDLAADSAMCLVIGVSMMALNGTDVFVANHFRGGEAAAVYSLSLRILFLFQIAVSFVTYPSWPALGEALERGEAEWVGRASARLLRGALVFGVVATAALALVGDGLVRLWSGGSLDPPAGLMACLAIYIVGRIWSSTFGILLRVHGRVRRQALFTALEAVLHLVLCALLVRSMGLVGLALGSSVALFATRAWALPLEYVQVRRALARAVRADWPGAGEAAA